MGSKEFSELLKLVKDLTPNQIKSLMDHARLYSSSIKRSEINGLLTNEEMELLLSIPPKYQK
ncbi:hypothetical protein [Vibrio sagamiensis]|uniref:Uncharacterized protein n=1 Tax=Vibrio sagamiensis NBRC 104589 TaxID=1219064 RepID=A0A511QCG5_9VIBR|nr:hypothetical protein [Vibrio sagamiensis]PNQ67407.1 hypothetical protein C1141_08170 [Vibrio agarivorans]GEM74993.1 hypothetical protein VSA01S_11050 [Vibrio sagamiensis NBRC 104589]